jgi:hypothetical protein
MGVTIRIRAARIMTVLGRIQIRKVRQTKKPPDSGTQVMPMEPRPSIMRPLKVVGELKGTKEVPLHTR